MGLFLSLGIHAALLTGIIFYKVLWPEAEKVSSVEVELVENHRSETTKVIPKVVSALSNPQEETGQISSLPVPVEQPPLTKNAATGMGNIQPNEKEGAGSGNIPLPSTEGRDVLKVDGLSPDRRGLGNTESSGGNGNAEGTGKGIFIATGLGGYPKGGGIGDLPRLPFIPRQVLEVVPEKPDDNIQGEIDLILRIGTDGFVKEHRVSSNTTNSYRYLNNVIKAAYKSRWEAVTYNGGRVEYWVEKKYSFN
ncbi:MAG: hypothetical protein HF314_09120 [Ignavibacteria bacterium]|nr:hypothetical protein [Ignavibacteria bacterium]MCU7503222.1 hypothetical protein [Ignavibacteria bacterium]MCU7518214.1 hypothetical protein [Ignavibacteria bacterium]